MGLQLQPATEYIKSSQWQEAENLTEMPMALILALQTNVHPTAAKLHVGAAPWAFPTAVTAPPPALCLLETSHISVKDSPAYSNPHPCGEDSRFPGTKEHLWRRALS